MKSVVYCPVPLFSFSGFFKLFFHSFPFPPSSLGDMSGVETAQCSTHTIFFPCHAFEKCAQCGFAHKTCFVFLNNAWTSLEKNLKRAYSVLMLPWQN